MITAVGEETGGKEGTELEDEAEAG